MKQRQQDRYACQAKTEQGGRCRNWAEEQCPHGHALCALHNAMATAGKIVEIAKQPNAVLMVILEPWVLDEDILGKFHDLGVPTKEQDRKRKEEKHAKHAETFRRDAHAYREASPDSGVKVFEQKLRDVQIWQLYRDLFARYEFVNPHIQKYPDQQHLDRLVISFGDKEPENGVPRLSDKAWEALDQFTSQTMSTGEIWANPPRATDGGIVQSAKFGKPTTKPARLEVEFNDGLWAASEHRTLVKV